MTKKDWTILFVRLLGLYLIGTHLATFATTSASLIITLLSGSPGRSIQLSLFQVPVISLIALLVGLFLVLKASTVTAMLEKHDKR